MARRGGGGLIALGKALRGGADVVGDVTEQFEERAKAKRRAAGEEAVGGLLEEGAGAGQVAAEAFRFGLPSAPQFAAQALGVTEQKRREEREDKQAEEAAEAQSAKEFETFLDKKNEIEEALTAREPLSDPENPQFDEDFAKSPEFKSFTAGLDSFNTSGDRKDIDKADRAYQNYLTRVNKPDPLDLFKKKQDIKARNKKKQQARKKDLDQKDINAGIELMIALAEGVEPAGRIKGQATRFLAWAGLNPQAQTLTQVSGLLAGQVAKKIGGESGRLTDQDRIYALAVGLRATDTPEERNMKIAVFRSFQNPDMTAEDLRARLVRAGATLAPGAQFNDKGDLVNKEEFLKTGLGARFAKDQTSAIAPTPQTERDPDDEFLDGIGL